MKKETLTSVESGLALPLMEDFYTLQGEGYHTGSAAYFIRIGGCDVGCHWCDVKESWNPDIHPATAIEQIVEKARPYSDTVVITGGEPLMYNMEPLTKALKVEGKVLHLETSGSYALSGDFDWICLSPKKNQPPLPEVLDQANELKVVIYNKHDFTWAEEHAAKVNLSAHLFMQPEWSRREKMMPLMADYVMANPRWRMVLQSHKYMGLP